MAGEVTQMHDPVVSVIAVGPDETVPSGVPFDVIHLPSLQTDEVRTWIAENRQGEHGEVGAVYVMPGIELASKGTPSLAVRVSADEYLAITAAMPR